MSKVNQIIEELNKDYIYEESELVQGILEMARICFIPCESEKSEYDIYIHTDDPGKVPHFHVRKIGKRGNNSFVWDKCIRLDKAEYFSHGKAHKGAIPDSKIEKEVIRSLYKRHPKTGMTYWEYAVMLWNDNNSDVKLKDIEMPNYKGGIKLND